MKLYVYIFKRPDLKRFEIFKNIPFNCRPQFSDFFSKISAILLSTDSHIKCIVCICVSFLYICLTSETLHYPWIPSLSFVTSFNQIRTQRKQQRMFFLNFIVLLCPFFLLFSICFFSFVFTLFFLALYNNLCVKTTLNLITLVSQETGDKKTACILAL